LGHRRSCIYSICIGIADAGNEQAARTLALQAAYRKAEANMKRDDAPSAGEIRRLGILDAPLEEKNLKASKWFPHKEIN
jgi:NADH dehydrogenase (ubiquinone) Fe-S protein 5